MKLKLILLVIIVLTFLWYNQEVLIYPGILRHEKHLKEPFKRLKNGSYYKDGNTKILWIVLGGNNSMPHSFEILNKSKHSILLIKYPKFAKYYDEQINSHTLNNRINDSLKEINYKDLEINFICHSIGCAVGLNYLRFHKYIKPKKLILLAPFWKIEEVIYDCYKIPQFLLDILLEHKWNNHENLSHLNHIDDITILHGENDPLISWKQGERLSKLRDNIKFIKTNDDHSSIINYLFILLI